MNKEREPFQQEQMNTSPKVIPTKKRRTGHMSMMMPEFMKNNECNTSNCILVSVICSEYPSKNWVYLPKNSDSTLCLVSLRSALSGMNQGCSFLTRIFTQSNLELKKNPSILKYEIFSRTDPTIFSMKNILPFLV